MSFTRMEDWKASIPTEEEELIYIRYDRTSEGYVVPMLKEVAAFFANFLGAPLESHLSHAF